MKVMKKTMIKRSISLVMCVAILMPSVMPSRTAVAAENQTYNTEVEGFFNLNYNEECVLDALARANPSIDLSEATVVEEVDYNGNVMYVIETAKYEVEHFYETTLAELSIAFLEDSATEAQLNGNRLSYVLPDGTQGYIIEIVDQFGTRIIQITEGDKSNEIIIDTVNNQLKLDGEIVTIYENQVIVIQQDYASPQPRSFRFVSTVNHNMRAQTRIRSLTTGALITLVTSFFSVGASITVGIAQLIINDFAARRPEHTSVYATRRMYVNGVGTWRFVDSFYTWNSRTTAQRSARRTVYEFAHH